ncbi:hypothetical protein DBR17_07370 [Sphingomonas sp. HMWF008]|nr:hypothetical protein DBR17_07370 [Sphingomonas sp. HMWF008]
MILSAAIVVAAHVGFEVFAANFGQAGALLPYDDQYLAQIALTSVPFVLLALSGASSKRGWLTALILTCVCWGMFALDGQRFASGGEGGGANIGLGILLLFGPFVIAIASFLANATVRKREGADQDR